jgi:hypothetical protein
MGHLRPLANKFLRQEIVLGLYQTSSRKLLQFTTSIPFPFSENEQGKNSPETFK